MGGSLSTCLLWFLLHTFVRSSNLCEISQTVSVSFSPSSHRAFLAVFRLANTHTHRHPSHTIPPSYPALTLSLCIFAVLCINFPSLPFQQQILLRNGCRWLQPRPPLPSLNSSSLYRCGGREEERVSVCVFVWKCVYKTTANLLIMLRICKFLYISFHFPSIFLYFPYLFFLDKIVSIFKWVY